MLDKTLASPLNSKDIHQSILKEISPEHSLEGLRLKLKLQYLSTWCEELTHQKRPWCWEDWRWKEKGTTEDEMIGWHHWLNGYEFEQALGVGDGEGSLACCSPWGHKESDTTKRPNLTEALETRRLIKIIAKTWFQSWIQNIHNNMLLKHWKIRRAYEKEHKAAHFKNVDHRENYLSKRQWVLCPWEAAMKLPTLQKLF